MSKGRFFGATIVGLGAVALAGGLIASNMGFKLNATLVASGQPVSQVGETGGSADGHSALSLPFNRQTGLNTASALRNDIGAASVGSIEKLRRNNNLPHVYTGVRGSSADFPLEEGVGYFVKVNGLANLSYIVVGSDDPAYPLPLIAAGQPVSGVGETGNSADGHNFYAYKYHSTSVTASALRTEIGAASVGSIERLRRSNNLPHVYTGVRGSSADFPLNPGEAYLVKVNGLSNITFTASHY